MTAPAPVVVWTIGHSVRPWPAFLEILVAHFSDRALAPALAQAGIGYTHVPELGGMREPRPDSVNTALPDGPFRGYADHMATAEFERGLAVAVECARTAPTALMCAEANPAHCHRRLIADVLTARGASVAHLLAADGSEAHALAPKARVTEGVVTYPRADLFG
jgi:uncharacterized protein (DUF488 family)